MDYKLLSPQREITSMPRWFVRNIATGIGMLLGCALGCVSLGAVAYFVVKLLTIGWTIAEFFVEAIL